MTKVNIKCISAISLLCHSVNPNSRKRPSKRWFLIILKIASFYSSLSFTFDCTVTLKKKVNTPY